HRTRASATRSVWPCPAGPAALPAVRSVLPPDTRSTTALHPVPGPFRRQFRFVHVYPVVRRFLRPLGAPPISAAPAPEPGPPRPLLRVRRCRARRELGVVDVP